MTAELERVGNASSLHASGRRARRVVEESRERVAASLGVRPSDVVFTSGGTESDNLAIKGLYWSGRDRDDSRTALAVSAAEHHAVLDPTHWLIDHEGAAVCFLPVDSTGRLDLDGLRECIGEHASQLGLVSIMWANNEVGAISAIAEIADIVRSRGVLLHSDAVQAVGWVDVDASLVDALTVSGHKVGGPIGVGALIVGRDVSPTPLLHGGGQERDIRSGTLDVPAIAGFAAALEAAVSTRVGKSREVAALRDDLVARVLDAVPDAVLNGPALTGPTRGGVARGGSGDTASRLPGTAHFTFPGCEGDALLMLLDAAGVECSTGSACQAGVPQPSHVLLAMGADDASARGSLRFSLGHTSTARDVDELIAALTRSVDRARRAGLTTVPAGV